MTDAESGFFVRLSRCAGRSAPLPAVLHELYRSKEVRDAALTSGAYDGMGETFGQLDELLGTLGVS